MKERGARANPYNMYEVIEHDYSMTGEPAYTYIHDTTILFLYKCAISLLPFFL